MNPYSTELYHHGILGQRWGVRRFQNSDGTLTSEGKKRYESKTSYGTARKIYKDFNEGYAKIGSKYNDKMSKLKSQKKNKEITKEEYKTAKKDARQKANANVEKEREAALRAWAQTTSRGRNLAAGSIELVGAMSLAAATGKYAAEGNMVGSLLGGFGTGVLAGMAETHLGNELSATKYRK